ncbi:MAG: LytTR family DNA-binding domain-containing protein [Bacteroidota bacterium]
MRAITTSIVDYNASRIPQLAPTRAERSPFSVAEELRKVALPTFEGINFEKIQDIISIEAQGNYAQLRFTDGRSLLVCKTLRDIETLLNCRHQFIRIHRSFTINLNCLKKYTRGKGGTVMMEDNSVINVSAGKKQGFLEALKLYFG